MASDKKSAQQDNSDALSVRDYLAILNATLTQQGGKIIGEVSDSKTYNGHVYFSLKDKSGEAILSCVIWRFNYARAGIELENGMEIVINGAPNIYAKNGRFSFIADTIELVGEGALRKQYEKLKAKLTTEGLFDPKYKRQLPIYPKTIGVITSMKGGVVIHDYSNNLKKFGFISKIVDSRVEGPDAIKELLDSVRTLKKESVDVLVIIRGGGSLESFAAFNNEMLVREIVNFPAPVIVGVGHHVDVCLVGLAADKMVSTPTAVADLLNESWEQAVYELKRHKQGLIDKYSGILSNKKYEIQNASSIIKDRFTMIFESFRESEKLLMATLYKFNYSIQTKKETVKKALETMIRCLTEGIEDKYRYIGSVWTDKMYARYSHAIYHIQTILEHSERNILQNNPERQLKLGYSIIVSNDQVVRSVSKLKAGDMVTLKLSDGGALSEIKNIIK